MSLSETEDFVDLLQDSLSNALSIQHYVDDVQQWRIFEGVNADENITHVQVLDKGGVAAYEIEVRRIGGSHE